MENELEGLAEPVRRDVAYLDSQMASIASQTNEQALSPCCWAKVRAELIRLARENKEWRTFGVIEVATRNPNVASYVKEWEARAERAESELAALRKRVADAPVVTLGAIVRGDVVMSVMDDPGKRVHLVEESV